MDFLAFRLYAPLASWGDVAVGEHRPSQNYPGRSAVLGLLAAALGIRRDEEARLAALSDAFGVAVAVYDNGALLRDYHTTQVPSASALKKRPHRTRSDELAFPKSELNTILSTRDYRTDACSVVLVWAKATPPVSLDALREALLRPHYVLYLGRKSCPLAMPLQPRIVHAEALLEALQRADFKPIEGLRDADRLQRLAWEGEQWSRELPGAMVFSTPRKDDPVSRARWQFADRTEYVAVFAPQQPDAKEVA